MKVAYLELAGFRGFREKARIDFSLGPNIVSGRNGAGKSSIFDALEFVLTGRIDKYRVEKAGNESMSDYLWWRGSGNAEAHYVKAGFVDGEGRTFEVTRSREEGCDHSQADIEDLLCSPNDKPQGALDTICKTSLIRDEFIAALSVDLKETERFDLVRSALGTIEATALLSKAKHVLDLAGQALERARAEYENTRLAHNSSLTQLSAARDQALAGGDTTAALARLAEVVPGDLDNLPERTKRAKAVLSDRRLRLNERTRVAANIRAFLPLLQSALSQQSEALEARAAGAAKTFGLAEKTLAIAKQRMADEQRNDAVAAALESVVSHGSHIGLVDGRCPLCNAVQTDAQFQQGLGLARERLKALGSRVAQARDDVAKANREYQTAFEARRAADQALAEWRAQQRAVSERDTLLRAELRSLGIELGAQLDPDLIEGLNEEERSFLIDLERSLIVLEASQAISRVTDLDKVVSNRKSDLDRAAKRLASATRAVELARAIDQSVKRTNNEVVYERLALISPLLQELYQRLRPHTDWQTMDYSIRGDVRRLLSLRVGDDLNPQFLFSSGQRRAAGLAFLLAVHLSRSWCRLNTLLLDDPVQHIDDYRALHLVEVLAAMAGDGRQIICAVEDDALAALLSRRLVTGPSETRRMIELEYGEKGGASVKKTRDLSPLPQTVLKPAPAMAG